MPRVPAADSPGLLGWVAYRIARRRFGQLPEPLTRWAHSRRILLGVTTFERSVSHWTELDPASKVLATLRAAQVIGCPWCIDFGSMLSRADGVSEQQLRELHRWRTSDAYTPAQRLCLDYAEAASATPLAVTDAQVQALRAVLSDAAVVELAMMVAVEHQRSRFNGGLGLASQGFTQGACAVGAGSA